MFRLLKAARLVKKLHAAEQDFRVAAVCHPHPAVFPGAIALIWKVPWREIHSFFRCSTLTASRAYILQTAFR